MLVVALCFGALSAAVDARSTSSPPEVIVGDQRSSPVADHSRVYYGGLFYPRGDSPLAAAAGTGDGLHGPGEEDDSIYLDQEAPQEDGLAVEEEEEARDGLAAVEQPKRSMGMLRLGRTLDKRPRSMAALRLGRRSAFEATGNKRSMGMLRLGRRAPAAGDFDGEEEEEGKRSMGMLRLGRSQGLRRRAALGR